MYKLFYAPDNCLGFPVPGPISPPTFYGSPDNLLVCKRINQPLAALYYYTESLIILAIRFRNQIVPTWTRFRMQMYSDSCYTSLPCAHQTVLPLSTDITDKFTRLCLGRYLLPSHAFKLGLNKACALPDFGGEIRDIIRLIYTHLQCLL